MKIEKSNFGITGNGHATDIYALSNNNGMQVKITNYGGTITSIHVPDKNNNISDVVLGFDTLEGYTSSKPFLGCIVGRYGNRIANGTFNLNGKTYRLATNNGQNHLHGGNIGFDKVVWKAEEIRTDQTIGLKLTYLSKNGEEGYPGNLDVTVTYTLTNENAIQIDYFAFTDQPTLCNLTNHSAFNLKDAGASPILNHELILDADYLTPVDETMIPTGEIIPVNGTPFDFRQPVKVGARIESDDQQLKYGHGYDHNFVLNGSVNVLRLVGKLSELSTGRLMEIWTTEPGIQFYSGNFLKKTIIGKNNTIYDYRHGLCLETQHYPDSPNHPHFPSTVLLPGEQYKSTTIYKFMIL